MQLDFIMHSEMRLRAKCNKLLLNFASLPHVMTTAISMTTVLTPFSDENHEMRLNVCEILAIEQLIIMMIFLGRAKAVR